MSARQSAPLYTVPIILLPLAVVVVVSCVIAALPVREFFIAGEPIEQMGDAAEKATSGEVVLSPAAAQLLLPRLGLEAISSRLSSSPLPDWALGPAAFAASVATGAASSSPSIATSAVRSPKETRTSVRATPSTDSSGEGISRGATLPAAGSNQSLCNAPRPCPCTLAPSSPPLPLMNAVFRKRKSQASAHDQLDLKLKRGVMSADGFFTVATNSTPTFIDNITVMKAARPFSEWLWSGVRGRRSLGDAEGELGVSRTMRQSMRSRSSKQRLARSRSQLSTQMEDALRCFVPALVEERVEAGQQDEWLSESRKLVTVFMRIVGLGGRLCEVHSLETLDRVVRLVQHTTCRYGGQVTRLICDDKGVRFLIGFGMPGRAHEDDESRAVVSSLHIQSEILSLRSYDGRGNLAVAVGITSGTVFCGEAGSERRREYTINGARVNIAARLMAHGVKMIDKEGSESEDMRETGSAGSRSATADGVAGGGHVIVAPEVRAAVLASIERSPDTALSCEFIDMDEIMVKGSLEPVAVFKALRQARQQPVSSEGSDFSGRTSCRQRISLTDGARESPGAPSARSSRKMSVNGVVMEANQGFVDSLPKPRLPQESLIGRVAELGQLRRHLDQLFVESSGTATAAAGTQAVSDAGAPQPLFIVGATGMGKSALLASFFEEARSRSPFVVASSAIAVEATTPFFVWRTVFQRLLSRDVVLQLAGLSGIETSDEAEANSQAPAEGMDTARGAKPDDVQMEEMTLRRSAVSMPPGRRGSGAPRAGSTPSGVGATSGSATPRQLTRNTSLAPMANAPWRSRSEHKDASFPSSKWRGLRMKAASGSFHAQQRAAETSIDVQSCTAAPLSTTSAADVDYLPPPVGRSTTWSSDGKDTAASSVPQLHLHLAGAGLIARPAQQSADVVPDARRPRVSRWVDACLSVLALSPRGIGVSLRPNLDRQLLADPVVRQLAPLLNPVLAPTMFIEENAHTRGMSGKIREVNQLKVMLRVLELKLAGVRGVLAFEDCQWMDNSSWRLTREVMPLLKGRVLTVVATRATLLDAHMLNRTQRMAESGKMQSGVHGVGHNERPLTRHSNDASQQHSSFGGGDIGLAAQLDLELLYRAAQRTGRVIKLEGLSLSDTRVVMAGHLGVGVDEVPEELTALVAERSQGTPLHINEMIKLLLDKQIIRVVVPVRTAATSSAHTSAGDTHDKGDGAGTDWGGSPAVPAPSSDQVARAGDSPNGVRDQAAGLARARGAVLLLSDDLPTQAKLREEWLNKNVPASLQAIITERVDKLSPSLQMLLKVCAVVCHGTFSMQMAQAVSPSTLMHDDAIRLLAQLEAVSLINSCEDALRSAWARPNDDEKSVYTFSSTLVQEVVYRKLPERQRRDLHGKAATYMAQRKATDTKQARNGYIAVLAHHYLHAGKCVAALKYLSMAAHLAMEHSAYNDALVHFEDALSTVEKIKRSGPEDAAQLSTSSRRSHEQQRDGENLDAGVLNAVHAHLLHQSAICYTCVGKLQESVGRLLSSLKLLGYDDVLGHGAAGGRGSKMLLSLRVLKLGVSMLFASSTKRLLQRLPPTPEALQEAQDVVSVSPLNETELPCEVLSASYRLRLRAAAVYEQLAFALEQCGSLDGADDVTFDSRTALYCALRATSLALQLPFLTPTLARCFATLSLVHTSHAATKEASCSQLNARLATRYQECAQALFASPALKDRSKSDMAWGLFTEGVMLADAGKWEHALRLLHDAAHHLDALQAVRLRDDALVHIAYIHLARCELNQARTELSRVKVGDAAIRRRDVGFAAIALFEGNHEEAHRVLTQAQTSAHGLLALCQHRLGNPASALALAVKAQSALSNRAFNGDFFFASTWVLLQLLQAALSCADARVRKATLSRTGRATKLLFSSSHGSGSRLSRRSSLSELPPDTSKSPKPRRPSLSRASFLGSYETDGDLDLYDWDDLVEDPSFLYNATSQAISKFLRYARVHTTSGPMANVCRAAFVALHSDDTGAGPRFSPLATSQLRNAVVQSKALGLPFERGLACLVLSIYDPRASERQNALRQAEKALADAGILCFPSACEAAGARLDSADAEPKRWGGLPRTSSSAGGGVRAHDLCTLEGRPLAGQQAVPKKGSARRSADFEITGVAKMV